MGGFLSRFGDPLENVNLREGKIIPLEKCLWEKVDMMDSANKDSAFILADLGEIYRKLEDWRRLLPRVEPFYALKCNPHPVVARFLADAGVGFDCASKAEIEQILNLGVHPSRIVYANPCKQNNYIRFAASNNVELMTFDGVQELIKIKKHFPSARLLLRIQSNNRHKSKVSFNNKFGCHVKNSGTFLAQAWAMKMNIVGVSFHVGSHPEDVECYSSAIADAHTVFTIAQNVGFKMEILDIGGGFTGKDDGDITFKKTAEAINKSLDQFFPASKGVEIIAEPGRYLVTTAFTLAVNIIGKRVVSGQDREKLSKTETQNWTSHSPLAPSINTGNQHDDEDKNSNNSNNIRVTDDGRTDDGRTDDGRTDDGRTDDGRTDDGRTDDGRTDDGRTDDGRTDDGRTDDGRTDDGRTDDGRTDDGRTDDGRTNDGRTNDGRTDDGRTDDGRTDDGRTNDGRTNDGRTDDGRTNDGRTDDGRTNDGRTDDGRTDDGRTNDGRTDDGRTNDGRTDDGRTDDGRTNDGRTNDGRTDDGRTNDGRTDDGRTNDGRTNDGRTNDCRTNDGRTNDGRTNDGRTNDGRTNDGRTNDDSLIYMYYVNDGIYGTFANVASDFVTVEVKVLKRLDEAKSMTLPDRNSIIWGPSCDSLDCVMPHCRLPELEVGQWLYFCNMGAYTLSLACNFNGIERPLVFPVCSKHYWNKVYPVKRHVSIAPDFQHKSKSSGESNRSVKSM